MMTKIPILLDDKDALALFELARNEYRDPRQQAAIIIRQELQRRGLLSDSLLTELQVQKCTQAKEKNAGPATK